MGAQLKLATRAQIPPARRGAMAGASAAGGSHPHTGWMRRLLRHRGMPLTLFRLFLIYALG